MTFINKNLLAEIEAFLARSGMGGSYFGKAAVGNSELVSRLRDGKRVWPETEAKILSFIAQRDAASSIEDSNDANYIQGQVSNTATIGGEA